MSWNSIQRDLEVSRRQADKPMSNPDPSNQLDRNEKQPPSHEFHDKFFEYESQRYELNLLGYISFDNLCGSSEKECRGDDPKSVSDESYLMEKINTVGLPNCGSLQIICPDSSYGSPERSFGMLGTSDARTGKSLSGTYLPHEADWSSLTTPTHRTGRTVLYGPSTSDGLSSTMTSPYRHSGSKVASPYVITTSAQGSRVPLPGLRTTGPLFGGAATALSSISIPPTPRTAFGMPSPFPMTPSSSSLSSSVKSTPVNRKFMEPPDGYIYQVQFKRAHKNYILAPSASRDIVPGDFVKVEADRGEDMGIVLSKQRLDEYEESIPTAGYRGRGFASGHGDRKFIFRLASAEERSSLVYKVEDEERALEVIRQKVSDQMLPMTILDAEYQFDRHKLTFYFEADRRIDFRELVSDLFSMYKTRIWMQQVDTSSTDPEDPGFELAKATGFMPRRDEAAYIHNSVLNRSLDRAQAGFHHFAAYPMGEEARSGFSSAARTPSNCFAQNRVMSPPRDEALFSEKYFLPIRESPDSRSGTGGDFGRLSLGPSDNAPLGVSVKASPIHRDRQVMPTMHDGLHEHRLHSSDLSMARGDPHMLRPPQNKSLLPMQTSFGARQEEMFKLLPATQQLLDADRAEAALTPHDPRFLNGTGSSNPDIRNSPTVLENTWV